MGKCKGNSHIKHNRNMNRILSVLLPLCLFVLPKGFAQTDSSNYVMSKSVLDEQGSNTVTTVVYCDGLGRKVQTVSNGIKPGSPDNSLLSHIVYDGLGRVWQKNLPVATSGLNFQPVPQKKYNDDKALSATAYDALNRPVSITAPGNDMGGRGKKRRYLGNNANSVKRYTVNDSGTLTQDGYYPQGQLRWEQITDENNNITDIYTDFLGQKILERHKLNNTYADTYFVYNDCCRLCFVLQPMYQSEPDTEKYAFKYRYNARGLIEEKTIPGCKPVTYTYDSADRMVTVQDGEMQRNGQERHYSYDGLGRIKTQTLKAGGTTVSIEKRNYYDGDYSFIDNGDATLTSEAKSLLRYSGTMGTTSATQKQLGYTFTSGVIQRASDGTDIVTACYYDQKGRVVEKNSKELGTHIRREQFTYTFTGDVLTHTAIDYNGPQEVFRSVTTNIYDAGTGKLTATSVRISVNGTDAGNCTVATYTYDDYGRVATATHGSAVQTTTYDVRDWTTELAADNFTEQLSHTGRYYNGSVNSIRYTGPCYDYAYQFSYDGLDRMTSAGYYNYREPEEDWAEPDFCEYASYDNNGNITNIRRTGFPDEGEFCTFIDDLELEYSGNQLIAVTDRENDLTYMTTKNFMQYGNGQTHYTYNDNGAQVTDANRGIVFTEYDSSGYPKALYFKNGGITQYIHTPDGKKLRTVHTIAVSHISKPFGQPFTLTPSQIHSITTHDYWDTDIICKNGTPEMFLFDGGFASIGANALTWHYYVKDHLGSTRIVQNEQGAVENTYNYYPFGTIFDHWAELYSHGLSQPFKFNGKELDTMFDLYMYDYGARLYDPLTGRWTSTDPQAEKYYSVTPYLYCLGNPVRHIDSDGRAVETVWDLANLAMDVVSLKENVSSGNYGAAFVDGIAGIVDGVAVIAPFVPGGAGTALKAYRAKNAFHAAKPAITLKATKYNYRKVLQQTTGKIGKGYEAHHTLPQKYRNVFEKLGINIDKPGNVVWRTTEEHRKNNYALTREWDNFILNDSPSTPKQIYEFRDKMEKKYFKNQYDTPPN